MGNYRGRGVPWPADQKTKLERLWAVREDGKALSTNEIGRRMNLSKNAIVGQSHRMGLERRPSPIKRAEGAAPAPRKAIRPAPPPLPPLASVADPVPPVAACVVVPVAPLPVPAAPVILPPPPVLPRPRPSSKCCWPIGEPGARDFRFCDGVAEPSRPYCTDHCQRAYVKHVPTGGVFQFGPAPGFVP